MFALLLLIVLSFLLSFFFVAGLAVCLLSLCFQIRNLVHRVSRILISPRSVARVFIFVLGLLVLSAILVPWYLQYYEVIEIPDAYLISRIRFPPPRGDISSVTFFFAIASTPEEFQQRYLIRKQMRALEELGLSLDYRFYCGQTEQWAELADIVQAEQRVFQDIVLLPINEQYRALVTKMRTVFFLALQHSIRWSYLVKLDGDVCLYPEKFIDALRSVTSDSPAWLWAGHYEKTAQHVLDPSSVLYVPPRIWPADAPLPGFMHGPVYILSWSLVKALADERNNPNVVYIGLEDVSIGISIAKNPSLKRAVTLRPIKEFLSFTDMWALPSWMCDGNSSAAHFNLRHNALNYKLCLQGRHRVCKGRHLNTSSWLQNRHG